MDTSFEKTNSTERQRLTGSVHHCKVTIIAFEDALLKVKNDHNHQVVFGRSEGRQVVQNQEFCLYDFGMDDRELILALKKVM